MTSKIAIQRIDNALEKQATNANPNFTRWDKEDAINKGLNDWIRRQVHGSNQPREGEEESQMRVDDLQPILVRDRKVSVISGDIIAETSKIPKDYRYYNRLTVLASKGDCSKVPMKSYFVENGNVDDYLQDYTFSPSFDFEQSFHIMSSNKFTIYHNNDFTVDEILLSYYKNPQKISCEIKDFDKEWEWKDDVAEVIIEEAIKNLAGNIENQNAYAISSKNVEENN